ncbi:MAG: DNA repair protein RadC [Verrucomicrobiota bacterium]|jgi:DNA repair protein RadC
MNSIQNHQEILARIVGPQAAASLSQQYQSLTELCRADPNELRQLAGVGPVRATQIHAALELANRLSREILGESPILDGPEKIADYMREEFRQCTTETLYVLLLNTRRRLIRVIKIATGTVDTLLVHSREVFRAAIAANASAIALCHNHPSSITEPSAADLKITRDLIRAGQLLKIEVLDHVILGTRTDNQPKDYASLRELGHFYQ